MDNTPSSLEATIIRRYPHPVSRVYRAWIMPEHLEQWFIPFEGMTLKVERFDFREGGEYLYRFKSPEGECPVRGKFLVIRPEKSLIYSFMPLAPHPDADKDTVVSVFFSALADGDTEVEIRHTLFPDVAMRDCHSEGWNGALDNLAKNLSLGK